MINRSAVRSIATLVAGIAIGVVAVGATVAEAHPTATHTKAKIRYITVDAAGFSPDSIGNAAQNYFNNWDPAMLSDPNGARCYNAAVPELPGKATLKSMTIFYTQGSDLMTVQLNRQHLVNNTSVILASLDTKIATTPTYTSRTLKIKTGATVNNDAYGYSLGVCPDGTSSFSGVRIEYTITTTS